MKIQVFLVFLNLLILINISNAQKTKHLQLLGFETSIATHDYSYPKGFSGVPINILENNIKNNAGFQFTLDTIENPCWCSRQETSYFTSLSAFIKPANSKFFNNNYFRVGINYMFVSEAGMGASNRVNRFTDSFFSEQIGYTINKDILNLQLNFIHSTPRTKRFSAYTGFGVNGGLLLKGEIIENYRRHNRWDFENGNTFTPNAPEINIDQSISHPMKNTFFLHANIPFGLSFRYLKYLETAIEFNGFVGRQFVKEGNNYNRTGKSIGLHLRYNFEAFPIIK